MRILYIDDLPINGRVMRKIARTAHCEVLIAESGKEALALLAEKPDLILTDFALPDLDGPLLIRQIRQMLPTIPIIVFTANGLSTDRQQCLEAGCTDYIAKPFHFSDMVVYLNRYRETIG